MEFINKIRSLFSATAVAAGYSLTSNPEFKFKNKPTVEMRGKPLGKHSAIYQVNQSCGEFELLGHCMIKGETMIKLRNTVTADIIILKPSDFTLLFKHVTN